MYRAVLIMLAMLCLVPVSAGEAEPAVKRRPPVVSPEIHPDRSVTFRLKAPQAKEVSVRGQWANEKLPMTKDEYDVWSVTSAPIPSGVWEYSLVVDEVVMIDPSNRAVKPERTPRTSQLILAGDPPAVWDYQDVPHGTVHHHVYTSQGFTGPRELTVYTPPGYETSTTNYPLLVLQHGAGGNQTAWTVHGKAHFILDNLIANKRAAQMIVLMLDGYVPLDSFRKDLIEAALPLVEKLYRVEKKPELRAIAGLSMGGIQSLSVGLAHDEFAWIGAFSSNPPPLSVIDAALADAAKTNARLRLLWIAIGKDDFLFEKNQQFKALLDSKGIRHEFLVTEGKHAWPVWRQYLADFAPRLFVAP